MKCWKMVHYDSFVQRFLCNALSELPAEQYAVRVNTVKKVPEFSFFYENWPEIIIDYTNYSID